MTGIGFCINIKIYILRVCHWSCDVHVTIRQKTTHLSIFGTNFWEMQIKMNENNHTHSHLFQSGYMQDALRFHFNCLQLFDQNWMCLTMRQTISFAYLHVHHRYFTLECPSCFLFWKRGKRVAVVERDQREITLTTIMNQSDERTESYNVHFCTMHAS